MPYLNTFTPGKSTKNPNQFKKIIDFGDRFIDFKMGIIGAGVMSCIVFMINYDDSSELHGAVTASLKQGGYTFLFGGIIMRGCELLATRINKRTVALAAAIIIPSAVSIGLTYGVHSMKGTPKPVESTLPTAAFVIPSTAVWGYRKRRQYSNPEKFI
jgi:hypothetical protein